MGYNGNEFVVLILPSNRTTISFYCQQCLLSEIFISFIKGRARTQFPTIRNYAPELPTFGVIAGVSPTQVQWKGLTLGEPPSWSRCPLCQVSMICTGSSLYLYHTLKRKLWCLCKNKTQRDCFLFHVILILILIKLL